MKYIIVDIDKIEVIDDVSSLVPEGVLVRLNVGFDVMIILTREFIERKYRTFKML